MDVRTRLASLGFHALENGCLERSYGLLDATVVSSTAKVSEREQWNESGNQHGAANSFSSLLYTSTEADWGGAGSHGGRDEDGEKRNKGSKFKHHLLQC